MSLGIYAMNAVLNSTFTGSSWTVASHYVALFTVVPDNTTSGTELSYANGYARAGADAWTAASGGLVANNGTIQFAQATDNWGAVYGWAIFDQGSAGNRIHQGSLTGAVTINSGHQFSFATDDLQLTFTSSCG